MSGLHKKISIILFILLIFILGLGSINAQGNDTILNNASDIEEIPVKTYTDLQDKIDSYEDGSEVELNESYKYDSKSDNKSFVEGVVISKNMTLVGNNDTYIDGNFAARGLYINPNCNVVLKNIIFKNGYSKTHGGAINVGQNSILLIDNCTFHSNKVYNADGGAINGQIGTSIDIHNSEFYNNTSKRVSKLEWKEYKRGMGSCICMRIGTTLRLYDTIFRDNVGHLTTILIITWDDVNTQQSTLYVKNCTFENNTARTNAAIYLDEFGIGEIVDSVFRNNVATYSGGIISLDTAKSAIVKNCTFEGNNAIKGGAIYINSYDPAYVSNAKILDSTFKENIASEYGGAIYSVYGITEITNCKFNENGVGKNGGAVYARLGSIKITDCEFNKNQGEYGGALLLKADSNVVKSSSFIHNVASVSGGAIYSTQGSVSSSGCHYSKNSAPKASNVYGLFYAKVTKYVAANGAVKIKIVLSSPWKMSLSQKIKVNLKGYTSNWFKTDSKGVYTFTVPKKKQVTKKTLSISMDQGFCQINKYIYKNPGKITVPKSVKKSSNLKVTIKNSQNKKPIKQTNFTVKIFTGKKYKTLSLKTNSKGVFKISMKKYSQGNHKISIYLSNTDYYINKKISFKIK